MTDGRLKKEESERNANETHYPSIEPGKVLLVLADFCSYYYHSLYYVPKDSVDGQKEDISSQEHIGMFQDSFLIYSKNYKIDLRYFPHFQNIEFYSEKTDKCPWFLENIGNEVLYARTSAGVIKLMPGDRKEVNTENAEPIRPILSGGDLYPAAIIEKAMTENPVSDDKGGMK